MAVLFLFSPPLLVTLNSPLRQYVVWRRAVDRPVVARLPSPSSSTDAFRLGLGARFGNVALRRRREMGNFKDTLLGAFRTVTFRNFVKTILEHSVLNWIRKD